MFHEIFVQIAEFDWLPGWQKELSLYRLIIIIFDFFLQICLLSSPPRFIRLLP